MTKNSTQSDGSAFGLILTHLVNTARLLDVLQVLISGERLTHGTHLNFDDARVSRLCAGQQDCACHILRVKHP